MSNSLATKLNKRKHVDIGAKAARSKSKRLRLDSTKDIELAQLIEEPGIESAAAIPELKGPISKKLSSAAQRFIVFIGNLPYTANSETVSAHFAKIKPKSVRHLTKKGENKSKGFAFLEFEAYDRMRTCLKLYHHSMFDDGKSAPRRINVELTAGGGGAKSDNRREKLKQKNQKLNEERKRRAIEEEKAKEKANLRAAKKTAREKRKQHKLEGNSPQISTSASVPEMASCQNDIHPSRRAQMMNT